MAALQKKLSRFYHAAPHRLPLILNATNHTPTIQNLTAKACPVLDTGAPKRKGPQRKGRQEHVAAPMADQMLQI
jgi:hypothetical protein